MQLGIHYFHICSKSNLSTQDETSYNLEWKEYQKRDHHSSRLHDTRATKPASSTGPLDLPSKKKTVTMLATIMPVTIVATATFGCNAYSYSIVQDYIFSLEFISISNNISLTIHIFISSNPPQLQ